MVIKLQPLRDEKNKKTDVFVLALVMYEERSIEEKEGKSETKKKNGGGGKKKEMPRV